VAFFIFGIVNFNKRDSSLKKLLSSIAIILSASFAFSLEQDSLKNSTNDGKEFKVFLAYELGEMAFNNFQNFSGEIGVKLKNDHLLRFVYQNVKLSEKHLSSDFARAVDGKNVRGLMKSYELFYDFKIYELKPISKLYFGLSAGYADDFYVHTITDSSIRNNTWTAGFAPSYRETDLFKIKGLYFNLAFPFRYYFNPLKETKLEDSTVKRHLFVNNIWFFIGYQF
jgi:hypothetical protein